jgi:RHS repeat-associated protein
VKQSYWSDHLGSIRAVIGTTGAVVEGCDYDVWGVRLEGRCSASMTVVEGFTGKERDGTGLDSFGARSYLSAYGRWGSVDALSEKHSGWSPYVYVLANPLKLVDPDGRQVSTIGGFTEGVITLRAILGDPASQQGVRTAWAIRLGGTLALVAAPVLATVALQHPATTAVALKEATDFAFGLLTDAPDPEGVGGGTLGQAAGRLGDDAVRIAARGVVNLPFRSGDIILKEFQTSKGMLDVAAEVQVVGQTLHLKDIAVFPRGTEVLSLGTREVAALRNQLAQEARSFGFDQLRITGTRISGANPGKTVDTTIDLTKLEQ